MEFQHKSSIVFKVKKKKKSCVAIQVCDRLAMING